MVVTIMLVMRKYLSSSHLQIMSANLTVYHPNISIHAYPWLKLINNSHSSLRDVCQYWDEELKIRGSTVSTERKYTLAAKPSTQNQGGLEEK